MTLVNKSCTLQPLYDILHKNIILNTLLLIRGRIMKNIGIVGVLLVFVGLGYFFLKPSNPASIDNEVDSHIEVEDLANNDEASQTEQTKNKYNYNLVDNKKWKESDSSASKQQAVQEEDVQVPTESKGDVDPQIKKLISSSGVEKQLSGMSAMLEQQMEILLSDESLSDEETEKFLENFRKNFNSDDMIEKFSETLANEFSEDEQARLASIYEDPLVSEVLSSDVDNVTDIEQMQQDYMEFQKQPLSAERRQLFEELDRNTGASEQAIEMTSTLFDAFAKESGENIGEEEKKAFGEIVKKQVIENMAFKSQSKTDDEIRYANSKTKDSVVAKFNRAKNKTVQEPFVKSIVGMKTNKNLIN